MDGHQTVTREDGARALRILTRENGAFDSAAHHPDPVIGRHRAGAGGGARFPDLTSC